MSVFVVPRDLGIKVGDVLSSAQAGGVMHKVNDSSTIGKICMIKYDICYPLLVPNEFQPLG